MRSSPRSAPTGRRIVVVAVPPVDELDLVGPLQVFHSVNRLAGRPIYRVELATNARDRTVDGEGGVLTFVARRHITRVAAPCDSVLLVCGLASRSVRDRALSAWLRGMAGRVRRMGAVCVGVFLLAEAGLLDGRRATTHWRFGRELASAYPKVCVEHDPVWVKDGVFYTSAGISAGVDLALAWVEEDCGAALAHEAARELVLFLRRPAGQPQLGTTPAQHVLQLRVEAARRLLERTEDGLKGVAARTGFGGVDVMRRAFVRLLGLTPRRYRELARQSPSPLPAAPANRSRQGA